MSVPASVATQMSALNAALNLLVKDRERINSIFENDLGSSVWDLLSAGEKTGVKNALIADMNSARDQITAVNNALAAL